MKRSSPPPAAIVLVLLLAIGGTSAIKVWYGAKHAHPNSTGDWVRGYVTTDKNSANSDLLAVGLQFTRGMFEHAQDLPKDISTVIPGLNFLYEGHEFNIVMPNVSTSPFPHMYLVFNHHGHPAAHNPPLGAWDNPHWDIHFEFESLESFNKLWDPSKMGPCFGANPQIFTDSCKPIAERCYPKAPYANVNEFVWRHGQHLANFTTKEWNPVQPFNQTLVWGQMNGKLSFLEPMINNEFLRKATAKGVCYKVTSTPDALPSAISLPRKYCIRSINKNTVAVELSDFKTVPKGDCTISPTNPASPRSYCPWDPASAPATCKPAQP